MSRPSEAIVKRLYAVSGNRCAFPKCDAPLVHEGKVTGRICHIQGATRGSARYNEKQSDEDRHGFQNLILMCPLHHDVIDADEVAYTVDRLCQLKADHEANQGGSIELTDSQAHQLAISLSTTYQNIKKVYNQNVSSINQSGGITAHTVNVPKLRRVMGDEMKRGIDRCPRDKVIVVWFVAGDEETHSFAQEIFSFMKAKGFHLFGEGPQGNVFLGAPRKGVSLELGEKYNNLYVGFPDGSERP
jgi:hypothetical protein